MQRPVLRVFRCGPRPLRGVMVTLSMGAHMGTSQDRGGMYNAGPPCLCSLRREIIGWWKAFSPQKMANSSQHLYYHLEAISALLEGMLCINSSQLVLQLVLVSLKKGRRNFSRMCVRDSMQHMIPVKDDAKHVRCQERKDADDLTELGQISRCSFLTSLPRLVLDALEAIAVPSWSPQRPPKRRSLQSC